MQKPNILFIMTDDHASHAMSCYGSKINKTPNMDRLANMGARFDTCFCTNSICAPSRAVILTGKHSHLNGVKTLEDNFDGRQQTLPKILQKNGYQTAIIGKWHLGHGGDYDPTGFDYWSVFQGQGEYHNPIMYEMGDKKVFEGYATNIVTDLTIDWLDKREKEKPFFMMTHHKAPHRNWQSDKKHMDMYTEDIPYPDTFNDTYENRSDAVKYNEMEIEMLTEHDLKEKIPTNLSAEDLKKWKYQRYMKDYLRCVASVDDNIGRLLDYLEENDILKNTIIVYTSDQGFFLGDHGWFDKRYMLEESLKMPFLMAYENEIAKNIIIDDSIVSNLDFAPTFLDYCGIDVPEDMQGQSFRKIIKNEKSKDWQDALYYRYWVTKGEHGVSPHYGIRTKEYKLICYLDKARNFDGKYRKELEDSKWPQWELFDLTKDSEEIVNLYDKKEYQDIIIKLKEKLYELKKQYKDYED